jgi:lipopolysaccharide transport system ATP-binding protein
LFLRRRDRLLALLGRTRTIGTRTVLEDISFDAYPGEAIGIVGENGSGKTTLLRAVAGISTPDAGTIRTDKPVAAILELGVGFHPEFTGRENAQLYGALLGVPEAAMTDRLEDIMAFAELGELVDQPLRTYSSGMSARLAFAVATNVDPKVLVAWCASRKKDAQCCSARTRCFSSLDFASARSGSITDGSRRQGRHGR